MIPNEKVTSYPLFAPNQVLSDICLNQAFDYLDEQERLTRAYLIGTGIVCGLQIRYDPAESPAVIHLTKGYGITSEGYLIIEPDDVDLVAYRPYTVPTDLLEDYFNFAKPEQVQELVTEGDDSSSSTSLSSTLESDPDFLTDKVVLLFLELTSEALRNCTIDNCDDRGVEVKAKIRPLLVSNEEVFLKIPDSLLSYDLPEIVIPRVHFDTPEKLRNCKEVYREFFTRNIRHTPVIDLDKAISQASKKLKLIIPDFDDSGINKFTDIFRFPEDEITSIQYYYDFLRDVACAYHELREVLLPALEGCLPDTESFPRHLTLGTLNKADNDEFRTVFSPSHAITLTQQKIEEVRFLFERINQMILNFRIPIESSESEPPVSVPIKITPSIFGSKNLSGKSMPFYYESGLRSIWDPSVKGQDPGILSWHNDDSIPDSVHQPLKYDLEPYNFFRIEGHIGKKISEVQTRLGNILQTHPLPISLIYLNKDATEDFLEKHPAIEHYAGVLSGGTFIIVHSGDAALCDFSLPYRALLDKPKEETPDKCLCRTEVRECKYEWFDTKYYLSKLARYKYFTTTAEKRVLFKNYVILVYKYEIQGQSILTGDLPKQVTVPAADLADGQISAIARKLNEAFPAGLVFDYSPEDNKLIIRHFANQTFRIEWRGLQGNQIRYAYTDEGIFIWNNKKWQLIEYFSDYKIVCRIRNEYRPEEYQLLHENEYYAGKYPRPKQTMPTKEELFKWLNMIQKRAVKSIDKLPIKNLLKGIKRDIDNAFNVGGPEVQLFLIGSWANGSWVSKNASENKYKPEEFLPLRKKVTGRKGPSDINLLVSSKSVTLKEILKVIENNKLVKDSGYAVNILMGEKDSQRGIPL